MSLRIGDKVIISDNHKQLLVDQVSKSQRGTVKDFKWNLVFIDFENGERDWVEIKKVHAIK